jgi:hypothetical protein
MGDSIVKWQPKAVDLLAAVQADLDRSWIDLGRVRRILEDELDYLLAVCTRLAVINSLLPREQGSPSSLTSGGGSKHDLVHLPLHFAGEDVLRWCGPLPVADWKLDPRSMLAEVLHGSRKPLMASTIRKAVLLEASRRHLVLRAEAYADTADDAALPIGTEIDPWCMAYYKLAAVSRSGLLRLDSSTTAISFAMTGVATTEIHYAETGKAGGGGKRPSVWERRHEAVCRLRAAGLPLTDAPALDCFDEGYEEGFTPPKSLREGYEDLRRQAEESLRAYEVAKAPKDDGGDDVMPPRSPPLPAVVSPLDGALKQARGEEEEGKSRKKKKLRVQFADEVPQEELRIQFASSLSFLEEASEMPLLQDGKGEEEEDEEEEVDEETYDEGEDGDYFEEVRLPSIPEEEEEDEEAGRRCADFVRGELLRAAVFPRAVEVAPGFWDGPIGFWDTDPDFLDVPCLSPTFEGEDEAGVDGAEVGAEGASPIPDSWDT